MSAADPKARFGTRRSRTFAEQLDALRDDLNIAGLDLDTEVEHLRRAVDQLPTAYQQFFKHTLHALPMVGGRVHNAVQRIESLNDPVDPTARPD